MKIRVGQVEGGNYDAGLADRVFTTRMVGPHAPKFTVSASLENWRQDDSNEQKKNPTAYLRLTVSVDPGDRLGRAALRGMHWLQIGRVDRYTDDKAKVPDNAGSEYVVGKFLTGDAATGVGAKIPFGKTFLDGAVTTSPYMTDNGKSAYERTATSLTFWDAPNAFAGLNETHQYIVQSYTAFLVDSEGDVMYQVDWSVKNYWNGGNPVRKYDPPPAGKIPRQLPGSLPNFLSNPKQPLYRGTGKGIVDIANPVRGIADVVPVQ
jgi:hypothetical protein